MSRRNGNKAPLSGWHRIEQRFGQLVGSAAIVGITLGTANAVAEDVFHASPAVVNEIERDLRPTGFGFLTIAYMWRRKKEEQQASLMDVQARPVLNHTETAVGRVCIGAAGGFVTALAGEEIVTGNLYHVGLDARLAAAGAIGYTGFRIAQNAITRSA